MITTRISIVMPAYNEADSIAERLKEVQSMGTFHEIIVVDDGSSDKTAEIVQEHEDIRLVKHPYNIGNGAAVKSGIRAASGDVILLMDADGQHPASEIPKILEYIEKYDMVVGARTTASDARWHRTFANWIFNSYASYVVGYPIPDLTSGFRAIRADIAHSFVYLLPNSYSYPTTLTISLFRAGYSVKYHPFVAPRRQGGSSGIKPIRDGLRFLLTTTRLAVLFVPLKIFLPLSILFIIVGGGYTIYTLASLHRFSGFGGLVVTLGFLIFLIGLISEQIAMLRFMNSER
jgi:glycosyltransferase involved in cell wall biosynthesis